MTFYVERILHSHEILPDFAELYLVKSDHFPFPRETEAFFFLFPFFFSQENNLFLSRIVTESWCVSTPDLYTPDNLSLQCNDLTLDSWEFDVL